MFSLVCIYSVRDQITTSQDSESVERFGTLQAYFDVWVHQICDLLLLLVCLSHSFAANCHRQSLVVAGLVKINVIKSTTYWTADNVASAIQVNSIEFLNFIGFSSLCRNAHCRRYSH